MAKRKPMGEKVIEQRKAGKTYAEILEEHAERARARIDVAIQPLQALEERLIRVALELFATLKDWPQVEAQLIDKAAILKAQRKYAKELEALAIAEAKKRLPQEPQRITPTSAAPTPAHAHATPRDKRDVYPLRAPEPAP